MEDFLSLSQYEIQLEYIIMEKYLIYHRITAHTGYLSLLIHHPLLINAKFLLLLVILRLFLSLFLPPFLGTLK